MRLLIRLLSLFVPRETQNPAESGGNVPPTGGDEPKPQGGSDPEGRPDYWPEKFWDQDIGYRHEAMGKAYSELEGKLRQKEDDIREKVIADMKAGAPESYELQLSEDTKIPENVEFDLNEKDPMVEWFFGFAKENGMSQDTVDAAINQYVQMELARMPNMEEEIGKLGDHGQDRLVRVHNWMQTKLSDDQFAALSPNLTTAAQIEALETLMKTAGPSDFESDTQSDQLTLEELRTMQNDPRYWREQDKAFIEKVQKGYERLYRQ